MHGRMLLGPLALAALAPPPTTSWPDPPPASSSAPATTRGASTPAAVPATASVKIPFEKHVLANGLRVILHVDRKSPLVAVNLWYHVGSKDEKPGRTGFAHLFEHLMFMGSRNAPGSSFDTIMEAWGGHNNGSTSTDRTNYFEIGPSNLLETFLWLEADRLATLPEMISAEELGKQRKVVQNERRQSIENRPYGKSALLIPEALYPARHPYSWSPIGSHADLEAAGVDDVRGFFNRFYVPSNASLVIAGDFDPAEARRLVERVFGWQPRQPRPAPAMVAPVALAADKRIEVNDKVQLPRLYLVWHSPAVFAAGDADLEVAAQILGGGKSSRLYRSLVFEKRLAQSVSAGQDGSQLGGQLAITVTAKPDKGLDELERAVDDEVARLRTAPPTVTEVERALNQQLAAFFRRMDGLGSRADLLNHYEHLLGDPGGAQRDLERYAAVTPDSVRVVLERVTRGKRLALRIVPEPPAAKTAAPAAGRTAPAPTTSAAKSPAPAPRPAPAAKLPAHMAERPAIGPLPELRPETPLRFVLKNGLEVIAAPRRGVPIVAGRLVVRAGSDADDPELAGLAAATADMLDEGAASRSALEIAADLEQLGARLALEVERDGSSLVLQVPSTGFPKALGIAADVATAPRFAEADWKRVQGDRITALVQRRDQPEAVIAVVADRVVFGDLHPYGRPVDGFERTVTRITVTDLARFHGARWRPNNATLVLAGDLDPVALRPLIEKAFGSWKRKAVKPALPGPRPQAALPRLVLVDRPGAPQTVVRVVAAGPDRSSPDRVALSTANTVLGGSFTSRLNLNLREQKGYTYGARSSFAFLRRSGSFGARAAVFTKVTDAAVSELLKELRDLRSAPVRPEELTKGRAIQLGRLAEDLSTVAGTVETYAEGALYRLPLDEPARFVRSLLTTDAAVVHQAVQRAVDPDKMALVMVGDRAAIEPGLRALGLPAPEMRDADGEGIAPR